LSPIALPPTFHSSDALIACWPCPPDLVLAGAVVTHCELCGTSVAAAPVSVRCSQLPGWHIVCRSCYSQVAASHPVRFAGRIQREATELPESTV
jgi:hypothetical protein